MINYKKYKNVFSFGLLIAFIFLSGCETYPQNLGITPGQWEALDQAGQDKILTNYRQIKVENEAQVSNKCKAGHLLLVKVHDGQVMMPPFTEWENYKPAVFNITAGECKEASLKSLEGDSKIDLRMCFKGNILYIDPSRYDLTKKNSSITITSSPLWEQGFTYTDINSDGYVKLKGATIEIKQIK